MVLVQTFENCPDAGPSCSGSNGQAQPTNQRSGDCMGQFLFHSTAATNLERYRPKRFVHHESFFVSTSDLPLNERVLVAASDANRRELSCHSLSLTAALCLLLSVGGCSVIVVPFWVATTCIGVVWGALFLSGLLCSTIRQRAVCGLFTLLLLWLAHRSMSKLTDVQPALNWAIVSMIAGMGWTAGILLTPWCDQSRRLRLKDSDAMWSRIRNWSIWDMFCLSVWSAALCGHLPNVQWDLHLLCQLTPALCGGIVFSMLACEWAWRDRWTWLRMTICIASLLSLVALAIFWVSESTEVANLLAFAISGPVTVMTSQGLTVLAFLAIVRIDNALATRTIAL